jgi:hypothetical protein
LIAELVGDRLWNCSLHLLLRIVQDVFLPAIRDMFLNFALLRYRNDAVRRGDLLYYQREQMNLLHTFMRDHCKKAANITITYSDEKSEWLFVHVDGNKLLDMIAAPEHAWLAAMQHLDNYKAAVHVIKAWHFVFVRMLEWDVPDETIDRLEQECFLLYTMAGVSVAGRSQRSDSQAEQPGAY